jgi:hypothetical protein
MFISFAYVETADPATRVALLSIAPAPPASAAGPAPSPDNSMAPPFHR